MLLLRMGMDINQGVKLWRGLSPGLAGAKHSKDLPKGDHFGEERRDEHDEDKTADPCESLYEKDDV